LWLTGVVDLYAAVIVTMTLHYQTPFDYLDVHAFETPAVVPASTRWI
jgi:hypothetical protein